MIESMHSTRRVRGFASRHEYCRRWRKFPSPAPWIHRLHHLTSPSPAGLHQTVYRPTPVKHVSQYKRELGRLIHHKGTRMHAAAMHKSECETSHSGRRRRRSGLVRSIDRRSMGITIQLFHDDWSVHHPGRFLTLSYAEFLPLAPPHGKTRK